MIISTPTRYDVEQYTDVLVTVPDQETGELITNILLEKKLIACVNFVTQRVNFFSWQGEIDRDTEMLLILKSRADLFKYI